MAILLKDLPVIIESIKINGNNRTRKDYIESELSECLNSTHIKQLHSNLSQATARLRSLGVYDYVDIDLEIISSDQKQYKTNLTINIKEKGIPFLKMDTFVRKGAIISDIGGELQGSLRNPLGYGESAKILIGTSSTGSKDFQLQLQTPIISSFRNSLHVTIKSAEENPALFTSYKQLNKSLEVSSTSRNRCHKFSYEYSLRDEVPTEDPTNPSKKKVSTAVLLQILPSTKSAFKYSYTLNGENELNDTLIPQRIFDSSNVSVCTELALPPGTATFIKTDLQAHTHLPLGPKLYGHHGLTFSLGLGIGALLPLLYPSTDPLITLPPLPFPTPSSTRSHSALASISRLSDRYYAGGPVSMRGFTSYGIGPRATLQTGGVDKGDALGGDVKTSVVAMLSVPIPIKSLGESGARAILFLNTCSLSDSLRTFNLKNMVDYSRISVGTGVALPLGGGARAELTYSVPLRKSVEDDVRGFQFGFSLETNFTGKM
eukprot:gene862-1683_t